MTLFFLTLPFLLILSFSYFLSPRTSLLSSEFILWLVIYQFIFIGALGVGLIQSHIGCPMPLDQCYVNDYPAALQFLKFFISIAVWGWLAGTVAMSAFHFFQCGSDRE